MRLTGQRFYVQYKPDKVGLRWLLEVQDKLSQKILGRPVRERQLHLTVIHFGIYDEVLAELCRYKPEVSEEVFRTELAKFLEACNKVSPPKGQIESQKLAFYGLKKNTLVLEARAEPMLQKLHGECLGLLRNCLHNILEEDPDTFMRASLNFRYALTFKPHITLVQSVRGLTEVKLSEIEAATLHMHLMPLQYD